MKKIAIFGAGGMGRETACIIRRINEVASAPYWDFIGFFDDGIEKGTETDEGVLLGGMAELNAYQEDLSLVIAIGTPKIVRLIRNKVSNFHISFPNLIDPTVEFWDKDDYKIGEGNIICPHTTISCNVTIGSFNILNGDVSLRHDVQLGDYNSIMPGVRVSGGTKIGNENFFGLNSAVAQYITVGNYNKIGAGAILLSNVDNNKFYTDIPAQEHK